MSFYQRIWPAPRQIELTGGGLATPETYHFSGEYAAEFAADMMQVHRPGIVAANGLPVIFEINPAVAVHPEGYVLKIDSDRIRLYGADPSGMYYGWQTLLQLIAFAHKGELWPTAVITDYPHYPKRSFMVDMGRSIYTVPMLKHMIRLLARLKINVLHMHLFDDELCGIRFEGHDFGFDNPYAITVADLGEVVQYAKQFHVEIIPEIEGWAHVGSIVYHRPELRGGPGVYNGSSFLFCNATFQLMKDLITQVAKVMPTQSIIHLGLDEANWFVKEDELPGFTPEKLVRRYYDLLKEIGRELRKEFKLMIWGDHAGRPIPQEIQDDIIVEPWCYWNSERPHMDYTLGRYGAGQPAWWAGAGESMGQYRGAFHATRYFAQRGSNISNLKGIDLTFWGRNDLENHFITLFAGAGYIWNPFPPHSFADIEDYESFEKPFFPLQIRFQATFREAFPRTFREIRPVTIYNGRHWLDEEHGVALNPGVIAAGTANLHDFQNEAK